MSDGINLVLLNGNLGADPDLTQSSVGPILKMRLATGHTHYDKDKNLKSDVQWHHVTYFGPGAVGLSRILQKGSNLTVHGRLHTSSYEKNGEKRYKTEVIAREIVIGRAGHRETPRAVASDLDTELGPLPRAPMPAAPVSLAELPF